MSAKNLAAIRHLRFEDLGTFEPTLVEAGYDIRYRDVGDPDFLAFDPPEPDLVVVLGGPIGVYEEEVYPFLKDEIALIAERVRAKRPTLGICLGAQLIARSLGAAVYPSGVKEIGFGRVTLTTAGKAGPLRHLDGAPVLHWHGDTFDLPDGAAHLAATDRVAQQAFAIGRNVLALQFHPEADCSSALERWLVGHTMELASAHIAPAKLREDAARFGPALHAAGNAMLREWLNQLET